MKKFQFNLENVRHLRTKIEDEKKMKYGKDVTKLNQLHEKQNHLYLQLDKHNESIKNNVNQQLNVNHLKTSHNFKVYICEQLEACKKAIISQEKIVEQSRQNLMEAMVDRKSIDKIKDNKYEAYILESNLEEQKQIDELVSYKHAISY